MFVYKVEGEETLDHLLQNKIVFEGARNGLYGVKYVINHIDRIGA